ncbi:MAG TPA: hypothetical protein VD963_04160, partial [Phycisphaerales bacterium]|nr:hypothetical protein [Phycisphaerales bacterium]
ADPDALDRSHFTGGANYSATTLIAMLTGQQGNALITELAAEPKTWVSSGTETIPQNQAGRNYEEMYPEIHLNNGRFEVELNQANNNAADRFFGMRPADVLLALAVGPSFAPPTLGNPYPAHADVTALDEQWTTLPEALALATDFEPVPPPPAGTIQPIYFDLASANPRHAPAVFDRGHLRTDRYVPFFDGSTGTIDPELNNGDPEFDAAGGDVTLPPGVPMAAAVVDAFRTLPIGSLTQVIPGQVNICTAPGSVLRLLPGLAPDAYGPYPLPSGTEGWTTQGGTVLQRTAGGPLTTGRMFEPSTQVYDVAAAIQAYRDKAIIMARARNKMIDFRDTSAGANDGRFERSRVSGIREETGLVMPSEILGVHIRDAFSPTNPDGYSDVSGTSDLDNSIGRFGWAGSGGIATTNRTPGLDSFVYRGATGNLRPDEITDDYDEQLTIANLVLGSVSTRSDVFCVYFLVHGYLPSDVEGLEDRDPLVPSIARRYLMVVDRSNVLGAGDKPRILLFQELPL